MGNLKNSRGMTEYLLSKAVMLIFILGLLLIFYYIYQSMMGYNADDVASLEAQRLAKIIDGTISYEGVVSNIEIIDLKKGLMVGNQNTNYEITVRAGVVVVRLSSHPFEDIIGTGTFGSKAFDYADATAGDNCCLMSCSGPGKSDEEMTCTWSDIMQDRKIEIKKTQYISYDSTTEQRRYVTCVDISGCGSIQLRREYTVSV